MEVFLFKRLVKANISGYNEMVKNIPSLEVIMKFQRIASAIILFLLVIIFCSSAFYVARYFLDSKTQMDRYDNLAAIVEQERNQLHTEPPKPVAPEETAPPATDISGEIIPEPSEVAILPEYRTLHEMNSDLAGWITIEDTKIDLPVMHAPDRKDYYLKRNFDGEPNAHGCLYIREACDINAPSDNVTIYGHHMKDGTMFGGLKKYQKQSYWETHDTILFDTLYERRTYKIFAVFKTTATLDQGFPYHAFINAEDEADFHEFIDTCLSLSFYDTGIKPVYGDKIICLSTCEYTQTNGRLVVAAVMVNE